MQYIYVDPERATPDYSTKPAGFGLGYTEYTTTEQTLQLYDTSDEYTCSLLQREPSYGLDAARMNHQPEITLAARQSLLSYLFEVQEALALPDDIILQAFSIIDRYCCCRIVLLKHYQLVALSGLLIAAKSLAAGSLSMGDVLKLCDSHYSKACFNQMELHILTSLGFSVSAPTIDCFLGVLNERNSHLVADMEQLRDLQAYLSYLLVYHHVSFVYPASTLAIAVFKYSLAVMGVVELESCDGVVSVIQAHIGNVPAAFAQISRFQRCEAQIDEYIKRSSIVLDVASCADSVSSYDTASLYTLSPRSISSYESQYHVT